MLSVPPYMTMSPEPTTTRQKLSPLQIFSVVGPSLCIVHCLALPVILATLPVLGLTGGLPFGLDEHMIVLVILPVCAAAIVPGYLRHRQKRVLALMLSGMALLLFGSFGVGHACCTPLGSIVNGLGSLMLIAASLLNLRLSACGTGCHEHG